MVGFFFIVFPLLSMEDAEIDEYTYSIQVARDALQLQDALKAADTRSLVVFDVDQTLITEEDPYDRLFVRDRKNAKTLEALLCGYVDWLPDGVNISAIASRVAQLKKMILVDDTLAYIIKDLNARNIPTIALTDCKTGQYGLIPSLEDWRIKMLQDLGIEFNGSFASRPEMKFEGLGLHNKVPTYKKGILFTGHACDKGTLLITFLQAVGTLFEKVFCIDDSKTYLKIECEALWLMLIPSIIGIHYTAAEKLPAKFKPAVAELQLQQLLKCGDSWLTGKKAKELLKKQGLGKELGIIARAVQ